MEKHSKIHVAKIIYLLGLIFVCGINLLAWRSTDFCDWYVANAYPVILNTYARLTSLVCFSVGEIMLILAVGITAFGIGFFIFHLLKRNINHSRLKKFFCGYAWGALAVLYVMTFNCFILYHTSSFSDKYNVNGNQASMMVADMSGMPITQKNEEKNIYTKKNIAILRDYLVEQCNMLAKEIPHDENGIAVYEGDVIQAAVAAMQCMGEDYEQLSGFYVTPKYLACSGFFSQQSIMGYFFPFSMEANINSMMYVTNVAPTVCHELAHTKGFIFEDDANFIGYLACTRSEDKFLQYCGYLSVLNYVNNDFYESIGKNKNTYKKHIRISDTVANDNIFLTKEDWQEVEKKAVVKTETVKKVSKELMQTSLKLNGVEEGIQQYDEVVNLLLDYYDGILY